MRRSIALLALLTACASSKGKMPETPKAAGGFADDVAFLNKHSKVIVLEHPDGGRVAIAPALQGRVMTSAVSSDGAGLGFVHRKFFDDGKTGTAFDNYGGEDRFWLGPEGTKFSLYFAPGKPLNFDNWQTPQAFNEGGWDVTEQSASRVAMKHPMKITSHSGFVYEVAVDRSIDLLDKARAASLLSTPIPNDVKWIGFASSNQITNTGKTPWTRDTGLVNVWILAMFAPAKDAWAIVPFDPKAEGPIVRDDYFGKVPAERLLQKDNHLLFRCDGELRSKIGVSPKRAKSVLGSYSAEANLLTIVQYDGPRPGVYPSGVWDENAEPYAGDAINAYNDGPVAPGKPSLGGFYELETTSPGAELEPGKSLIHVHRTFHFVGPKVSLDAIAKATLGVGLP